MTQAIHCLRMCIVSRAINTVMFMMLARLVCIFISLRKMKIIVSPGPYPASKDPPEPCIKSFESHPMIQKEQGGICLPAVFWSKWRDSNSRHPAPKAGALPTALHLDCLVFYAILTKKSRGKANRGKRKVKNL